MHLKRSWKVAENHFQCSICTLQLTWFACRYRRLPDGLMKLVNLTQLALNDASVAALPQDIGRFGNVYTTSSVFDTVDCYRKKIIYLFIYLLILITYLFIYLFIMESYSRYKKIQKQRTNTENKQTTGQPPDNQVTRQM